jgi:hypothetical protein
MADSEGVFGGNGSVNWRVDVRNPIKIVTRKKPGTRRGWRQTGHDATPKNGRFTVTIKVPETNREKFLAQFHAAVANTKRSRLRFTLPIEPGNRNQISIRWPSSAGRNKPRSVKRRAAG